MDLAGRWLAQLAGRAARLGPVHHAARPDDVHVHADAREAGLTGSFAAFSLYDREVMIDLDAVARLGLRTAAGGARARGRPPRAVPGGPRGQRPAAGPRPPRAARPGGARADDPEHVRGPADQRPPAAQQRACGWPRCTSGSAARKIHCGRSTADLRDPVGTAGRHARPAAGGRGHGGRRPARREAGPRVRDRLAGRRGRVRRAVPRYLERRVEEAERRCGGCCASAWSTRTRRSRA